MCSGDAATGTADPVRSRNPKGASTAELIDAAGKPVLVHVEDIDKFRLAGTEANELAGVRMWLLVVYRNRPRRCIQSEVSRPLATGTSGRIERWGTRLPLPDLVLDDGSGPGDDEQEPPIDVDVTRR